jgi:hypothetical protein
MRRRRSALRRRYGHAKIPRVGGTDPNRMSAAAINRELDKLDKIRSKLNDEMIATGRGHETWSETVRKNPATSDDLTIKSCPHARGICVDKSSGVRAPA